MNEHSSDINAMNYYQEGDIKSVDPYIEAVVNKLRSRSEVGLRKYGTDLTRTDLGTFDWLNHLQEEMMDSINYAEVIMDKLKKGIVMGLKKDTISVTISEEGQDFQNLQHDIYVNAVNHGFWEASEDLPTKIALMHSELSEALEEYRSSKPNVYYMSPKTGRTYDTPDVSKTGAYDGADWGVALKPEGIAVEFADVIIRILDWAEHNNVDMWKIMKEKHEFNKSRPHMHGRTV